jgi:hypothetical protein
MTHLVRSRNDPLHIGGPAAPEERPFETLWGIQKEG